ncbi:Uncharacterised protein [Tatumella ptyseos]|uniref:Uncharacterized protein n=1 Tax=Tatumella ptyseos TaxID=82987 RepID=A0A2X5NLK6_9GAMM|nr:Uncharacterised protein [Tatumella ptyseos]
MKKILFLLRTVTLFFFLSGHANSYQEPVSIKENPVNEVAFLVERLAVSAPASVMKSFQKLTQSEKVTLKTPQSC